MKSSSHHSLLAVIAASFVVATLASAAPRQTPPVAQSAPAAGALEVPVASAPVPAAERVIPPHLAEAEKLLAELPNATLNVYGEDKTHRPFIDWSPAHPAARTVCSTFAALLLEHAYGFTRSQIAGWLHSSTPDADRIYDAIRENKGFRGFHEIARIKPGDFLVSKFFDDSKDTGHVMLVDGAPVQIKASEPIIPGTTQYAVTVIDSSASGHGLADTRHRPGGSFTGGIGKGVFRLYGDASGRIVGYCWSISPKSTYYTVPAKRLIAGRLTRGVPQTNENERYETAPAVTTTAAPSP